jgi:hypothetical protein
MEFFLNNKVTKQIEKNSNVLWMVEISFKSDVDAILKHIVFENNWRTQKK